MKKKLNWTFGGGILLLLILIFSATYAYFQVESKTSTNTEITATTPEGSNIILRNLIDNLHIRLSASDMSLSASREYYAAVEEDHNFETSQETGTHTIANVVLVKDEGNTYTCSGKVKINMDVSDNSMGKVLEIGDLILNISDNEDVINLKGEQLGIKEELDLSEISNTGTKEYPFTFEINSKDNEEIKIYVKFNNKTTAQNYLSGKELNMSVVVEDLSCKIKDQIAPQIEEFTIKGKAESPFTLTDNYTHKKDVTYTLSWNDEDVVSYCIKENETCTNEEYKPTEGNKVTVSEPLLSSGDGRKTINAYIKDETGNVSKVKTEIITLDETNPSVEVLQNSVTTDTIVVTIAGTDDNGITTRQCRIEEKSTNWTDAINVNGEYQCTISSLKVGTTYTIEGRTIDASGRISTPTSTIEVTTELTEGQKKALEVLKVVPNGISDNLLGDMYRFVGTKDAVDNYVCFGYSNASTDCKQGETSDYMYRIIGITPGGQLKLIKNTAIRETGSTSEGRYHWWSDEDTDISWPNSRLFLRLNGKSGGSTTGSSGDTNLFIDSTKSNVDYIKTSGDTTWYNKIEQNHSWWYGGMQKSPGANQTADKVYQIETGQLETQQNYDEDDARWPASQKVTAAIGLMYISDYYYSYAASGTNSSSTNCYSSSAGCINSWLLISQNGKSADYQYEWTMTRYGRDYRYYRTWLVSSTGTLLWWALDSEISVRPVFYLASEAGQIESGGKGTASEPFIIVK